MRTDLAARWKAAGYEVTESPADAFTLAALTAIEESDAPGGDTDAWVTARLAQEFPDRLPWPHGGNVDVRTNVFVRQPADGTEQSVVTRLEQGTVPSALVADALAVAMRDASESNEALRMRAWRSVTALQDHMMKDGARKVLAGGRAMQSVLNRFAAEYQMTPGELAMILSASVHSVLLALPGMTPELARAIAVELANGPRGE